jgi:S-adenosylmethionine/arginine decarboxylase-like enzyme
MLMVEEGGPWGKEVQIDLYGCDSEIVRFGESLKNYSANLCDVIGMEAVGETLVMRFGEDNLEGFSSHQFIKTSNISVHLDEVENRAMINIFSCREFDVENAIKYSRDFFRASGVKYHITYRG